MDLGNLYGIISSLGTLIGAVEKLIETLKTHNIAMPPEVHADIAAARDAHALLVSKSATPAK